MNKSVWLVVLALFPFIAHAGTVTVTWVPPTTCSDNSPASNCPTTGFEVLEGAAPTGTYTTRENVAATVTSRTYQNVAPGQRCFSVKTIAGDQRSEESVRACATVASLPPKAPTGITVTVQVTVATP